MLSDSETRPNGFSRADIPDSSTEKGDSSLSFNMMFHFSASTFIFYPIT